MSSSFKVGVQLPYILIVKDLGKLIINGTLSEWWNWYQPELTLTWILWQSDYFLKSRICISIGWNLNYS